MLSLELQPTALQVYRQRFIKKFNSLFNNLSETTLAFKILKVISYKGKDGILLSPYSILLHFP